MLKTLFKGITLIGLIVIGLAVYCWQDFKSFALSSVPIFAYHCISPGDNIYMTSPEELALQMDYMHKLGYKAITMREYAEARKNNTPLHKAMILTFDDGYKDNAQNAAPVLKRYGYVGNVYMAVKYIGAPNYLNWQDIATLKDYGWEIGSHTYNHIKLMEASQEQVKEELTKSKYTLEHGPVPLQVESFCYPYGSTSSSLTAAVNSAGYTSALTCNIGTDSVKTPIYELKRIGVFNGGGTKDNFVRNFKEALVVGWLEDKGLDAGSYWFKWRSKKMASWQDLGMGGFLHYLCTILSYAN